MDTSAHRCRAHRLEVHVRINLKSKKLIILISVLVAVIAVAVILAVVFSVQNVSVVIHDFNSGNPMPNPSDAPSANDVLNISKGKSIVFLSKDALIDELNERLPEWHAFAVVKNFPNIIDVHFVRRQAAVKIDIGGNFVYVDSFGYVVEQPTEGDCVSISSALSHPSDVSVNKLGEPLRFTVDEDNERLKTVLEAITACWRCKIDYDDIPVVFGEENVFTFDEYGNFIIHTRAEAQIKVIEPSTDLTKRLLKAYSVYYTEKSNLQQSGVVITVEKNGNIITKN